jgi:two-component system, NarL family, response regulator LiaR
MHILADARSYPEAIDLASLHEAEVIVLDDAFVCQPGRLEEVADADATPERALLALVADIDQLRLRDLFSQGVRAIVSSDEPPEHLADGLRAAAAGAIYISPNLARSITDMLSTIRLHGPGFQLLAKRLTPREIEVLNLVTQGRPNLEIAARLNVTEKTIKFHVSSILTKLAVRSRAELIALVANITDRPVIWPPTGY